jgi:hypothetical protein
MHHRCQSRLVEGSQDDDPEAFVATVTTQGRARKLPETTHHVSSPRPTTQPSAAPLTCAVVWAREVLHFVVNHPRIDGKDGVASSILAGGSTQALTSRDAGRFRIWGWLNARRRSCWRWDGVGQAHARMESTSLVNRPGSGRAHPQRPCPLVRAALWLADRLETHDRHLPSARRQSCRPQNSTPIGDIGQAAVQPPGRASPSGINRRGRLLVRLPHPC